MEVPYRGRFAFNGDHLHLPWLNDTCILPRPGAQCDVFSLSGFHEHDICSALSSYECGTGTRCSGTGPLVRLARMQKNEVVSPVGIGHEWRAKVTQRGRSVAHAGACVLASHYVFRGSITPGVPPPLLSSPLGRLLKGGLINSRVSQK